MSFETVFKAVLLEYIRQNGCPEAIEVTSWEEDSEIRSGGMCETCQWSDTAFMVDIYYRTPDGSWCFTYDGSFTSLLQDLVEIGDRMEVDSHNEDPSG